MTSHDITLVQEECSISSTEALVLSEGRGHKLWRCFKITLFLSINVNLLSHNIITNNDISNYTDFFSIFF